MIGSDRPVLVAHRAGNDPTADLAWADSADILELDVHLYRGRLEVRHAKAIWPTSLLFEKRRLVPRDTPRPPLAAVLDAIPAGRRLWLDLKGPDPRLASRVLDEIGDRHDIWVSARSWWLLAPFHDRPDTCTFRSAGTAWQRRLAIGPMPARWGRGVVIHDRLADERVLALAATGTPVVVWAVEERTRAIELLDRGARGLIIDDGDLLSELRDRIGGERR